MRALIIGEHERAEIQRVVNYAEANRLDHATMLKLVARPKGSMAIGDVSNARCFLPQGFRVAFSIEEQTAPLGWCRHISISVDAPGKLPNIAAAAAICTAFGFVLQPADAVIYVEDAAINIVEPLEDAIGKIQKLGDEDVRIKTQS